MAFDNAAMWHDWREIPLQACPWLAGTTTIPAWQVIADGDLAADQADALADPLTQGAAAPKIVLTNLTRTQTNPENQPILGAPLLCGWHYQIPIPNSVIDKQPARLAPWDGELGAEMETDGAGRVIGIEFENVLVSRTPLGGVGDDLSGFDAAVKFRGFGAPLVADATETQDTPICSSLVAPGAIFGDMSLPSVAPEDQNVAPTFAPDGVCRIRTLVQLPSTIAIGDVVEVLFMARALAERLAAVPIQWYGARYRWVEQPFGLFANTSQQMLGTEGSIELAPQPREDLIPYEP